MANSARVSGEKDFRAPEFGKRVYCFSELKRADHVAKYVNKWYDKFSHSIIADSDEESVSYYECVPVHKTSNVAKVRLVTLSRDGQNFQEFFQTPVYVIQNPSYKLNEAETITLAAELHARQTTYPCDIVFCFWKFYSSEIFAEYCKTGQEKRSSKGLKQVFSHPLETLEKNDRFDLERDLGKRVETYEAELEAIEDTEEEEAMKNAEIAELAKNRKLKKQKSGNALKDTVASTTPPNPNALHATTAAVAMMAIPSAIAATGLDVKTRWKNIDACTDDGVVEQEDRNFLRKKYAAMSASGNSANAGCIIAGAAAGATLAPVAVAGIAIGVVGWACIGAVAGAVSNVGTRHVVGKTADRLRTRGARVFDLHPDGDSSVGQPSTSD